jgi:hypothetical protein
MRRMLLALTLTVGVFVFPSSASATHSLLDFQSAVDAMLAVDPTLDPPPNDPTRDFAVGGFQALLPPKVTMGFSAHEDGPRAEDAWGHASQTFETGSKGRWRVVCFAVSGNEAALGLEPQDSRASHLGPGILDVRDSGLPGGAGDLWSFFPNQPEFCELLLAVAEPTEAIERGNILVHDATVP